MRIKAFIGKLKFQLRKRYMVKKESMEYES